MSSFTSETVPKKILVMCQRKEGLCDESNGDLVQNLLVPKIKKYIEEYLNIDNYTLEYLAYLADTEKQDGDEVDFDINVEKIDNNDVETEKLNTFLENHKKTYSVIIQNTCPHMFVEFQYVSEMLADSGILVLSRVNCGGPYDTTYFDIPPSKIFKGFKQCNILDYFQYDDANKYYTKNPTGLSPSIGGNKRRKTKRTKTKKRITRKSKKSKRKLRKNKTRKNKRGGNVDNLKDSDFNPNLRYDSKQNGGQNVGSNCKDPNFSIYNTNLLKLSPYKPTN